MESSTVGPKKLLYVGGLAEEVDTKVLQAAFIPFGDIVEVIFLPLFWIRIRNLHPDLELASGSEINCFDPVPDKNEKKNNSFLLSFTENTMECSFRWQLPLGDSSF